MVENSLCEYRCHFSTLVISSTYLINPAAFKPSLSTYTSPSAMSFSRVCMRIPLECRGVCLSVPACMHALRVCPVCKPPPPYPERHSPPWGLWARQQHTPTFNCSTQQSRPMNYTKTMRRGRVLLWWSLTRELFFVVRPADTHTHTHTQTRRVSVHI